MPHAPVRRSPNSWPRATWCWRDWASATHCWWTSAATWPRSNSTAARPAMRKPRCSRRWNWPWTCTARCIRPPWRYAGSWAWPGCSRAGWTRPNASCGPSTSPPPTRWASTTVKPHRAWTPWAGWRWSAATPPPPWPSCARRWRSGASPTAITCSTADWPTWPWPRPHTGMPAAPAPPWRTPTGCALPAWGRVIRRWVNWTARSANCCSTRARRRTHGPGWNAARS